MRRCDSFLFVVMFLYAFSFPFPVAILADVGNRRLHSREIRHLSCAIGAT
jgi:hypothetical protein